MKERAEFTIECQHYLNQWTGIGSLPQEYCPPGIEKIYLYVAHGLGIRRIYEGLCSIPLEEFEEEQGPKLWACNNNLSAHLFSAFSCNEFWEGDKSF